MAAATGRRYTDADRARAARMRGKGASYAAIMAEFGVSKSTLSYWLNPAARDKQLEREAVVRATGVSPSLRYTDEAVADRRYRALLAGDPCAYCGGPGGTVDHILPTSGGGPDDWDNLTGACLSCNSSKCAAPLLATLCSAALLTGARDLFRLRLRAVHTGGWR